MNVIDPVFRPGGGTPSSTSGGTPDATAKYDLNSSLPVGISEEPV